MKSQNQIQHKIQDHLKFKRTEQIIILIAHLVLLAWIVFALYDLGTDKPLLTFAHFVGMAIYGAGLIRICAHLAKRRFVLEQKHRVS